MKICVECNPDYLLTQVLTSDIKKDIIHSGCKSRVIFDLINNFTNSKGIIDEDLGKAFPKNYDRFKITEKYPLQQLESRNYKKRKNKIIILKPNFEGWVLRASRLASIDVRDYGLPNDESSLRSTINYQLPALQRLIEVLYEKSEHTQFLSKLLRA